MTYFEYDLEDETLLCDGDFIGKIDPTYGLQIVNLLNSREKAAEKSTRQANLYIKGSAFQHAGFVTSIDLPAFKTFPDAIIWGSRVFTYFGLENPMANIGAYVEAFTHYIPA